MKKSKKARSKFSVAGHVFGEERKLWSRRDFISTSIVSLSTASAFPSLFDLVFPQNFAHADGVPSVGNRGYAYLNKITAEMISPNPGNAHLWKFNNSSLGAGTVVLDDGMSPVVGTTKIAAIKNGFASASGIQPGNNDTAASKLSSAGYFRQASDTNANTANSRFPGELASGVITFGGQVSLAQPAGPTEIVFWSRGDRSRRVEFGAAFSSNGKWNLFYRAIDGTLAAYDRRSVIGFSSGTPITFSIVANGDFNTLDAFYINGSLAGIDRTRDRTVQAFQTASAGSESFAIGARIDAAYDAIPAGSKIQFLYHVFGSWTFSHQQQRTLDALFRTSTASLAPTRPNIWFDDDGSDWDGYLALKAVAAWHLQGHCNLIGVSQTTQNELYACGASRAILDSLGLQSIPVCHYKGNTAGLPPDNMNYSQVCSSNYLSSAWAGKTNADYPDMVSVWGTAVANLPNGSVRVVANGQSRGIRALFNSNVQTWKNKVDTFLISAIDHAIMDDSAFQNRGVSITDCPASWDYAIYNFKTDAHQWSAFLDELAVAQTRVFSVDATMAWSIQTGAVPALPTVADAPRNPLSLIRQIANTAWGLSQTNSPRFAWDSIATYCAVFGVDGTYMEVGGIDGYIGVNGTAGNNGGRYPHFASAEFSGNGGVAPAGYNRWEGPNNGSMGYFISGGNNPAFRDFLELTVAYTAPGPGSTPYQDQADLALGAAPFTALIMKKGQVIGLGTILSPNRVLTSASCVANMSGYGLSVMAGTVNPSASTGNEQLAAVASVIVHDEFDASSYANNLAILTLATPLVLGPYVKTIPLAASPTPEVGEELATFGWHLQHGGAASVNAKSSLMKAITNDEASGAYQRSIPESMLPASSISQNFYSDLGTVLVTNQPESNRVAVGIFSFVGAVGYPAIYTRISAYLEWIQRYV